MSNYVIVQTREFYAPQKKVRSLVLDQDTGTVAVFGDVEAARAAVKDHDDRIYYLAHNESARADYAVRRIQSLPRYLLREAVAA